MKRTVLLFFSIIAVLMMTSCGSKECTCACCTTQTGCGTVNEAAETTDQKESVDIENSEDSCENPSGASHYPYVESTSEGSKGSISITTAEHGDTVYDIRYNTIFTGLVKWTGHKCYSTAEKATKNPITVNSRGHEIIVTLTYENNSESFTLNVGDSQLLSISHSNFPSTKAYVYVIVT